MSVDSIRAKLGAAATFAFFGLVSPLAAQESGAPQGSTMMQGDHGPHLMMSPGLMMPVMNPANGRKLFAAKGCVVCHSVNGVGGTDAAALDASTMTPMMNPFDFTARMWTGAEAMIGMQREELGKQIQFTGQELADIIAFAHDAEEQKKFSEADIPPEIDKLLHADEEGGHGDHEMKEGGEMMKHGDGMKH
ncbi:c-type cytochrome [Mesorhizobium sp.]|uniref:c-type cytochrome n=1 Tax=Mesorhizobium sp. TaxID=1871066 RepID=UPI0025CF50A7|nr:c-type cytochrome [Mesorhizobium sp.]